MHDDVTSPWGQWEALLQPTLCPVQEWPWLEPSPTDQLLRGLPTSQLLHVETNGDVFGKMSILSSRSVNVKYK